MRLDEEKINEMVMLRRSGNTNAEIVKAFEKKYKSRMHITTVSYWFRKLREAGREVPAAIGRRSKIDLNKIK